MSLSKLEQLQELLYSDGTNLFSAYLLYSGEGKVSKRNLKTGKDKTLFPFTSVDDAINKMRAYKNARSNLA